MSAPTYRPPRSLDRPIGVVLAGLMLAGLAATSLTDPALAGAPGRREQLRFMWAMAGQESGWDYYARNSASGAFGKYQIMPFNWPAWAGQYLGDPQADQTPWNQERVAYGKIRDLYRWLGSWKRVAYWWLTGSSDSRERRWSSYARGYVDNIMQLRKRAPRRGSAMPARTSSIPGRGDWRRAGEGQALRVGPARRAWSRRALVRDGAIVRVRRVQTTRRGVHWLQVVTRDGRLGWLRQLATVPTRRPEGARRWADVRRRADGDARRDRRHARPRPR